MHEMGNVELSELVQISKKKKKQRIKARLQVLIVPYYRARVNRFKRREVLRISMATTPFWKAMRSPDKEHGNTMIVPLS